MVGVAWLFFWMGQACAADYAIAPAPAWVDRLAVSDSGQTVPHDQISDGSYYLLSDFQSRLSGRKKTSYRHVAVKAVNASGVESIANVEIRFDPAYSSLTLHSIDIIRGGRVIPKLADAQIRVLQRETALEYRIFDGSKTANVFLDDVRVDDIVDYAYTIEGSNPVFDGKEFGTAPLQFSVPIERIHVRLLVPADRTLAIMPRNAMPQMPEREQDGYRVHEWDSKRIAPLIVEPGAPGWYDIQPIVQWSEYADWAAVAHWAWSLYRTPSRLPAPIQAEVDRIARTESGPAERMLAALRFVQTEIRYLGVAIGTGSHAPNAPELVLKRRFGDCKDKALLTMTLLAGLGIEARAALVNTNLDRGIGGIQPSPGAFDHVLVRARIGDRYFWIDPTRSKQNGDPEHVQQSDYGLALIVDPATQALTPMKNAANVPARRTIHSVFDASGGFDKPARYVVTTVSEGGRADSLRSALATSNLEKVQQQYLNFYARYYADIAIAAPLEIVEDAPNNRVTVTERYDIAGFWSAPTSQGRREANINVPDIDEVLRDPPAIVRKAPLRLEYPSELSQRTEVLLPEAWPVKAETVEIEDPAFAFERKISVAGKRVLFEDRYQSRTDEVPGADAPRYAGNLARARDSTGYQLSWVDPLTPKQGGLLARFNWAIAALAVLLLVLWIAVAVVIYRYDVEEPSRPLDRTLQGIGGWLIFPAIALVVSPIRILVDLYGISDAFAVDTWAALTTYGTATYHAWWAPVLLIELAVNLALAVFSLLVAVMFFRCRRTVPRLYIALMASSLIARILDMWLSSMLPNMTAEPKEWMVIGRDAFFAVIWCAYFVSSRRVRSTFIMPRLRSSPSSRGTKLESLQESVSVP